MKSAYEPVTVCVWKRPAAEGSGVEVGAVPPVDRIDSDREPVRRKPSGLFVVAAFGGGPPIHFCVYRTTGLITSQPILDIAAVSLSNISSPSYVPIIAPPLPQFLPLAPTDLAASTILR